MRRKSSPTRPGARGGRTAPAIPPCRRAFNEGLVDRQCVPLFSGRYKLLEALRHFDQDRETVEGIAWHVRGNPITVQAPRLHSCTLEDRANWLKRRPAAIARSLGYNVMPTIQALSGDNVSTRTLRGLSETAHSQADELVGRCDSIHAWLRNSINVEYAAMAAGQSYVAQLLEDSATLVRRILQYVP